MNPHLFCRGAASDGSPAFQGRVTISHKDWPSRSDDRPGSPILDSSLRDDGWAYVDSVRGLKPTAAHRASLREEDKETKAAPDPQSARAAYPISSNNRS